MMMRTAVVWALSFAQRSSLTELAKSENEKWSVKEEKEKVKKWTEGSEVDRSREREKKKYDKR